MDTSPPRVNKKAFRESLKHPYSFMELHAFYGACQRIYEQILIEKPDLIVAPLRGADPILKTIRLFANLHRHSKDIPPIVYPRTGEQTDIVHQKRYDSVPAKFAEAFTPDQKEKELQFNIEDRIRWHRKHKPFHIFLIDEAFSGGSISEHYRLLEKIRKRKGWKIRISGLAVVNEETTKSNEFTHMVNEKRIRTYNVPRLFTTDSAHFLYPLIAKKRTWIDFAKRRRTVPSLAITRKALEGRLALLSDIQALWEGRDWNTYPLSRLPHVKERHKRKTRKNGFHGR